MIRAFLVDDEPPARTRLRQMLADAGDVVVVGEAGSAEEARPAILSCQPDLVFLDIEMPVTRGTAFAATLPEPRPFIVFATAFDQYAVDAFAVAATDYLLKPITRARLAGTLARVRDRLAHQSDLERELRAASVAQAHLMPSLPHTPGFDCAAATEPARAVGGDFYVARPLSGGHVALALGDVAGKGMSAGLIASSVQARLDALADRADRDPGALIREVNKAVLASVDAARFATLVYFDVDPESGAVQIVNAGHPAVIAIDREGSQQRFSSTGPAVGVLADALFDTHAVTLPHGGMLVAYSDGITEALDGDGGEFGEDRLADTVTQHRAMPAADLAQLILATVREYRGGAPAMDDATVLMVKRS